MEAIICSFCGYKSLRIYNFERHKKVCDRRRNPGLEHKICNICGFKCSSAKTFIDHKKCCIRIDSCKICEEVFVTKRQLNYHLRNKKCVLDKRADETIPLSNRIYVCENCNKSFESVQEFTNHVCECKNSRKSFSNSCSRQYICKNCNNVFTSSEQFRTHKCGSTSATNELYTCRKCQVCFNDVASLITHSYKCKDDISSECSSDDSVNEGVNAFSKNNSKSKIKDVSKEILLCRYCKNVFTDLMTFVRHACKKPSKTKVSSEEQQCICNVCKRKFKSVGDLYSHKRLTEVYMESNVSRVDDGFKRYFCNLCFSFFSGYLHYLNHECVRKTNSKDPYKTRCGICGDLFDSRQLWYSHRRQVHEHIEGGVQQEPWVKNNRSPPWINLDKTVDNEIKKTYEDHASLILDTDFIGRLVSIYNLPLDVNFSIDTIMDKVEDIYSSKVNAFRINISFGVFLRHIKTNAVRYFRPYRCSEVFAKPLYISRSKDLVRFRRRLVNYNIPDYLLRTRPNTEYIPIFVVQARIFIWNLNYVLGCSDVILPRYVSYNRGLKLMLFSPKSLKRYKDMLCMFRCLTYHRNKVVFEKERCFHSNVLRYFEAWKLFLFKCENRVEILNEFEGVKFIDFSLFEKCFSINLLVYEIKKDNLACNVYRSRRSFKDTMSLNVFDGHVSYIFDFKLYSKKYQCKKCDKLFSCISLLKRHENVCELCTQTHFPGGMYKAKPDIWKRLSFVGVHVNVKDTFWPWVVTFDCEAMLQQVNEKRGENTLLTHKHEPVSISVCSNVKGYDLPHCIVEENFEKLVSKFVEYLDECTNVIRCESMLKWGWILETIKRNVVRWGGDISGLCFENNENIQCGRDSVEEEGRGNTSKNIDKNVVQSKRNNRKDDNESNEYLGEGTSFQSSVRVSNENEEMGSFMKKKMCRENVYRKMLLNLHVNDEVRVEYEDHDKDSIHGEEFVDFDDVGDDDDDDDASDNVDKVDFDSNERLLIRKPDLVAKESVQICTICNESVCLCVQNRSTIEFYSVFETEKSMKSMVSLFTRLYFDFVLYINQVVILSFNAKKYDLNLLKKKLVKRLNLINKKNVYVIKKDSSYMCIANSRYKFCDLMNWLPPNCSYRKLLKNYNIDEEKLFFPYEYVTDFEKLEHTLPEIDSLGWHSSIHDKSVLSDGELSVEDNYKIVETIWNKNNMTTLKDLLVVYNNQDTIGLVKVAEKMQKFYFQDDINVWKSSISLAGVARHMLFREAEKMNVYFSCISMKQIPLYKMIKNNIFGGASILFKRYCKAGSSSINDDKSIKCKRIIGFDCTSMYLYCLAQEMPVNSPIIRKKETGFSPVMCDIGLMPIFWMDWEAKKRDIIIHHRFNSNNQEVRFSNFRVDGFSSESKIIWEYFGCYFHAHRLDNGEFCRFTSTLSEEEKIKRHEYTMKRLDYFKTNHSEYKVEYIYECEFASMRYTEEGLQQFIYESRPKFYISNRGRTSESKLIESVKNDLFFGFLLVDIHVPENLISYFEGFPPLFVTAEIPYRVWGDHMQKFAEEVGISKAPRVLLVTGMSAKNILLTSKLLKFYLQLNLVCTSVHQVVEYSSAKCFEKFKDKMCKGRLDALADPKYAINGECYKLLSNSAFGSLLISRAKHRNVRFVQGENRVSQMFNDKHFSKCSVIDEEDAVYEIESYKRKITISEPITLGFQTLNLAKLRLLEFVYIFLKQYCLEQYYQILSTDTDSIYISIGKENFDDIIKPEMKAVYNKNVYDSCSDEIKIKPEENVFWFPRKCCKEHTQNDSKLAGIFHEEFIGNSLACLTPKTHVVTSKMFESKFGGVSLSRLYANYLRNRSLGMKCFRLLHKLSSMSRNRIVQMKRLTKLSAKGVSKRLVKAPLTIFLRVLRTKVSEKGVVKGFKVIESDIYSYSQEKLMFSYFYVKREVLGDSISTKTLSLVLEPVDREKKLTESNECVSDSDDDTIIYDSYDSDASIH